MKVVDWDDVEREPGGDESLLFSDIEGSTRLLQQLGVEGYWVLLERQRWLLREAFGEQAGYEVDCEGDAFFVAFASAGAAIAAAAEAQRALASEFWPDRVRSAGSYAGCAKAGSRRVQACPANA